MLFSKESPQFSAEIELIFYPELARASVLLQLQYLTIRNNFLGGDFNISRKRATIENEYQQQFSCNFYQSKPIFVSRRFQYFNRGGFIAQCLLKPNVENIVREEKSLTIHHMTLETR